MKTKKDKNKKSETSDASDFSNLDVEKIAHLQDAVSHLLGPIANIITAKTPNITYTEALAVAAAIATNDQTTLKEIIASELPITADILNIVENPRDLIRAALLLEKKDFTQVTENQQAFIDSLQRWVFKKLNDIPSNQAYSFLLWVYGAKPDTNKYLINVKDCGTSNTNLLTAAKFLTN